MRFGKIFDKYGVTQADLAARLGINRVSVSRLLSERNDLRLSTLTKIADAVGCPVAEFFAPDGGDGAQRPDICAHIRVDGKHLTADTWQEWDDLVREVESLRQ